MASCKGGSLLMCLLLLALMSGQSMARIVRPFHARNQYFGNVLGGTNVTHRIAAEENKVLRAILLHRDHPDSPLSPANTTTFFERLAAAVQRSFQRRASIDSHLRSTEVVSTSEFQSPVVTGSGEYLMTISLGTPAQQFSAIVDTGSDLVWLQCSPCISCFSQADPYFDPSLSTSYSISPCSDSLCLKLPSVTCDPNCHYQYSYGDKSSTSGYLARETITVTDATGIATSINNFGFGCGNNNQGSFGQADGLVGLGQGPLSLASQISQYYFNVFSYCLINIGSTTTSSSPLVFGSTAAADNLLLAYTSILSNPNFPTFYYVPMTGISVNGVDLNIPSRVFDLDLVGNGGVIFDSGTTLTMLNNVAYSAVLQNLASVINYTIVDGTPYMLDMCYSIAGVQTPILPTMEFHFAGVNGTTVYFPLSTTNLFVMAATDVVCLAMAGSQQFSIIGNIQQADHHIQYDIVNQQIGWAQTTC